MSPRWPKKSGNFHFWWVLDAFFGFSMRTRHLPSLFYRFWHAFHQVFLKALRKTLARTSREPAKNLASTYDYCRTPSFKTGAAVLRPWAAFNTIFARMIPPNKRIYPPFSWHRYLIEVPRCVAVFRLICTSQRTNNS